ncbi:MAG: hypothetical protein K2X90_03500 [Candidatus Babeliaceae bacterium]|nr:hypothetical protein [Candidatus Babeliaceae bacterium]
MTFFFSLMLFTLPAQILSLNQQFKESDALGEALLLLNNKVPEDEKKGLKILFDLIQKNNANPEFLFEMGEFFEESSFTDNQNKPKLAFNNMMRAAELGYGRAFSKLALYYLYGLGTTKDIDKALAWFKKAREWYKKSRKNNNVISEEEVMITDLEYSCACIQHCADPSDIAKSIEILKKLSDPNFQRNIDMKDEIAERASEALEKYYYLNNDIKLREKYLKRILAINPNNSYAYGELTIMCGLDFENDFEKKQQTFNFLEHTLERANDENKPKYLTSLAHLYLINQQFDKVHNLLERVTDTKYLSTKYWLLGKMHASLENISADPQKALISFEKALALEPENTTMLRNFYDLLIQNPEIISQQKAQEILEKLVRLNDPTTLYELLLTFQYGLYGSEKDPKKAEFYLQKILNQKEPIYDNYKALIYALGIGVKKNVNKAKQLMNEKATQTQAQKNLLSVIKEILVEDMLDTGAETEQQNLLKKKTTVSFDEQNETDTAQPLASQNQPTELPKLPSNITEDQSELDVPLDQTNNEQIERKNRLIEKLNSLNKKYNPEDESFIEDINFETKTIIIDDPKRNKKIILFIGDDAFQQSHKIKKIKNRLPYDNRIQAWFTTPQEELRKKYDLAAIENHTFAQIVDYCMQLYGQKIPWTDSKTQLIMQGEIISIPDNKRKRVSFEYTFYQDDPGESTKKLYHRLARPRFNQG